LLSWVVFGLALILIGSRQTKQTAKRSLVTH
jgi:hypothetical protein